MNLDDGFDADNPYHSVALIYSVFLCERCGECYFDHVTETGEEVPYRLTAETVQQKGWIVRDRDPIHYDYEIHCPVCAIGNNS